MGCAGTLRRASTPRTRERETPPPPRPAAEKPFSCAKPFFVLPARSRQGGRQHIWRWGGGEGVQQQPVFFPARDRRCTGAGGIGDRAMALSLEHTVSRSGTQHRTELPRRTSSPLESTVSVIKEIHSFSRLHYKNGPDDIFLSLRVESVSVYNGRKTRRVWHVTRFFVRGALIKV